MVVISIPGLNEWAQQIEDKKNHLTYLEDQPNTSKRLTNDLKLKRSYDEADEDADAMEVENDGGNKEQRTGQTVNAAANVVSREHLLNFPLPDVQSKSCIVKVSTLYCDTFLPEGPHASSKTLNKNGLAEGILNCLLIKMYYKL